MNTSGRFAFLFLAANSSSKVTIFSLPAFGVAFLGSLSVAGINWAAIGVSPAAMDRSKSLILLGTKYSTKGSVPESKVEINLFDVS